MSKIFFIADTHFGHEAILFQHYPRQPRQLNVLRKIRDLRVLLFPAWVSPLARADSPVRTWRI